GPVSDNPLNAACPLAPVCTVAAPPNDTPAGAPVMLTVTLTPAWGTAFPLPSRSSMTGWTANSDPLWAVLEGWVTTASAVADPAPIVMAEDVAPVSPVAAKPRVRLPAAPVMARSVKLARPALLVVSGVVPPRVPPPLAIEAEMLKLPLTSVPAASRTWTAG